MPMPNKLPKFFDNHKICIICEGNEEYEYLKRLDDKNQYLIIGRNPKNLFATSDNLFELVSEKRGSGLNLD